MSTPQPGILAGLPPLARYLTFRLQHSPDTAAALAALQPLADASGWWSGWASHCCCA